MLLFDAHGCCSLLLRLVAGCWLLVVVGWLSLLVGCLSLLAVGVVCHLFLLSVGFCLTVVVICSTTSRMCG